MGGSLSRIRGSLIKRPVQRYNAENRAQKVLQKGPKASPKYASDEEFLAELRRTNPGISEAAHKKHLDLHERLKQVYVQSTDHNVDLDLRDDPTRPLPQRIAIDPKKDKHFFDADQIPKKAGKATLAELTSILTKAKAAEENRISAKEAALEYDLDEATVGSLVDYFHVFNVYVPEKEDEDRMKAELDPLRAGPDWEEEPKVIGEGQQQPAEKEKKAVNLIGDKKKSLPET